jgi:hypothetical protein
MDKPAAPYLIAIGLNLILLRFSAKAYLDKTSNGIMIATFALYITRDEGVEVGVCI